MPLFEPIYKEEEKKLSIYHMSDFLMNITEKLRMFWYENKTSQNLNVFYISAPTPQKWYIFNNRHGSIYDVFFLYYEIYCYLHA